MKEDIKTKIIAKAWKDPAFKKRLLDNPREAFREMGVDVPAGFKINVVEDKESSYTLVLPQSPNSSGSLSEKDFSQIAGAGEWTVCKDTSLDPHSPRKDAARC